MPERSIFETAGGRWLALTPEGVIDTGTNTEVMIRSKELDDFLEWIKRERIKNRPLTGGD